MLYDPNDAGERRRSRMDTGTAIRAVTPAELLGSVSSQTPYQLIERPAVERLLISHAVVVETLAHTAT